MLNDTSVLKDDIYCCMQTIDPKECQCTTDTIFMDGTLVMHTEIDYLDKR